MLIAKQKSETQIPEKWKWVETSIWTERMLVTLDNGVNLTGGLFLNAWDGSSTVPGTTPKDIRTHGASVSVFAALASLAH